MVTITHETLEEMTPEELREVRKKITQINKGKLYKPPGKTLRGYLPPRHAEYLELCVQYVYQNKMIKKETVFSFVSWSVKQSIQTIMQEIKRNARNSALELNQDYSE